MRIAVDTNPLYTGSAGVARYVNGLRRGLAKIGGNEHCFLDFAWPVHNWSYQQPLRGIKTFYRELVWAKFSAPSFLRKKEIQLLHTTGNILISPRRPIRHVVTLHDLAVLSCPEKLRLWHRISTRKRLGKYSSVDRILCISRFTADEAIKHLGVSAKQIEVVYNGSDFHPNDCPPERQPSFDVPSEFFLFVGSLEPGKNLNLLRVSYEIAKAGGKSLPPLLIVGARWLGVANEGPPPENWHYLGRIPDDYLVFLYRRALALVFPSKYEGFGLPIVEAMALNCPVICSAVASLPEVAGEAALFAEQSASAYHKAMRRMMTESDLRTHLISKGRSQAQKFSWEQCAEETLQVYQDAAG